MQILYYSIILSMFLLKQNFLETLLFKLNEVEEIYRLICTYNRRAN